MHIPLTVTYFYVGRRVALAPWTDHWARGQRYGTVRRWFRRRDSRGNLRWKCAVELDVGPKSQRRLVVSEDGVIAGVLKALHNHV